MPMIEESWPKGPADSTRHKPSGFTFKWFRYNDAKRYLSTPIILADLRCFGETRLRMPCFSALASTLRSVKVLCQRANNNATIQARTARSRGIPT